MDDDERFDERLAAALRSDATDADSRRVLGDVLRRGRRRRAGRRAAAAVTTLVAVAALGLALTGTNDRDRRVDTTDKSSIVSSSASSSASSTSTSSPGSTTVTTESTSSTGPFTSPTAGAPTTSANPPTTAPRASPWPPGTLTNVTYSQLTATVVFGAPSVPLDKTIGFRATIANPFDHWVFVALERDGGFGIDIGTSDPLKIYRNLAPATEPALQHATSEGNMTGVLLAPHGQFQFSGQLGDLENHADSVGTNRVFIVVSSGCCIGFGYVGGQAGTLVVEPPTTASTTTTSPA